MIAVFSYNMGPLLQNCLASIERHCDGVATYIYDDNSDDAETRRVLRLFESKYPVFRSQSDSDLLHWKTGNLWANMNRAVIETIENGRRYVLFMQDDMQVVRPLDNAVFDEYTRIFRSDANIAQVRVLFMKNPLVNPDHHPDRWVESERAACYVRYPVRHGVLATGIVDAKMLAKEGYQFVSGEANNAHATAARGWYSVWARNPIAMHLPWPPTENKRNLPWAKRVAQAITDRYYNVGCHRFRDMTSMEIKKMAERPASDLPHAEKFLNLADGRRVRRPWFFERSYAYPKLMLRRRLS